jgi:hypothetical protein
MVLQRTQVLLPLIITLGRGQVHVLALLFKVQVPGQLQVPEEELHTKLVRQAQTLLNTAPVPKAKVLQFTHAPLEVYAEKVVLQIQLPNLLVVFQYHW